KQFASRSLLISANAKIALHALRQSRNKAHRAKRNRACACKEHRRFLAFARHPTISPLNPFAPGVFSLRIRQDYRSYYIFLFLAFILLDS
ncbi:MAG: hypothetical protein J6K14_06595, partial [Clostridia bacterium]|nr:hypothetical protein [Clostridia bacterium]